MQVESARNEEKLVQIQQEVARLTEEKGKQAT